MTQTGQITVEADGASPSPSPSLPLFYCSMDEGVDHNTMTDPDSSKHSREVRQPFPGKVYEMLEDADPKDFSHIVSWNAIGSGFMVHNKELFTKQIVPHYFNQTKYKSFQRQLSLYGFQRVAVGENKGLRYHEKLRRGERDLVCQMKPVGYKPRGATKILERGASERITTADSQSTNTTTQTMARPTVAVPEVAVSAEVSAASTSTLDASLAEQQHRQHLRSSRSSSDEMSPDTANGTDGLPTVVSSSSLDRHGREPKVHAQQMQHQQGNIFPQVHLISPGQSPFHVPCGGQSEDESYLSGEGDEGKLQLGLFEGLTFYLMPPKQELLEEMIPGPCIVNLPPCLLPVVSTPVYPSPPVDGDVQMKKAWEIGFSLASSMTTPSSNDGTIASIVQAHPPAAPTPLPPSPKLLLDHCVDALDFHAIDVTTRFV